MEKRWYVLHSKPNKEQMVFSQLMQKGIDVFFPRIRVTPANPRSAKIRAYFPGYLFVHVDIDAAGANTFRWLPGAKGLVSFDETPAVVPAGLIAEIAQKVDAIDQAGKFTVQQFKSGDRVRITAGPFEGFDALFDKHLRGVDRVQVLLSFLSQAPQPLQLYGGHIKMVEPHIRSGKEKRAAKSAQVNGKRPKPEGKKGNQRPRDYRSERSEKRLGV